MKTDVWKGAVLDEWGHDRSCDPRGSRGNYRERKEDRAEGLGP